MPAGWISLGATVVGGAMSMFGASQSNSQSRAAARAQYEQAKKLYEFDWDNTIRKYDYAQSQLDVAVQNDSNLRAYQTAQLDQQYNAEMASREYEYKNGVAAFNRSEDIFEQQIEVNAFSSNLAHEEASRFFGEQELSINFQKEGLSRDLFQALDTTSFVKAEIELNKHTALRGASTSRRKNELQYQTKLKESSFSAQKNMIEQLQNEGKAKSRGTGRSASKSIQSAMMMAGMQQAQIIENVADSTQQFKIASTAINDSMMSTINSSKIQSGKADNALYYKQQEHNQGLRELKASLDSARTQLGSDRLKINLDRQVADMRANADRMLEPTIGPEIPRPVELPPSVFIEPLRPIRPPPPVKNAPQTISAMTTFGNAISNLAGPISGISFGSSD